MARYVGAIDQGTTSTRFIVFDRGGNMITSAQKEHRQIFPKPGWVEHDPVEIWQNTQEVAGAALARASLGASDLAAVGITNQRETTILWNKRSGKPLHNALVWQDTRVDQLVAQYARNGGANRFRAKTGLPLASYFSGLKLQWLLDNVPGARTGAESGELLFGNIDTWLLWNLTGGSDGGLHLTDVTNASRTQLMSLETLDWDDALLEEFLIPRAVLPRIVASSEVYGAIRTPALSGTCVAGILGDQQAALVGQACFRPGEAKNTYGTGCFLLMNTGEKAIASTAGLITTVAYKIAKERACYALEGSIAVTGALVQWLRDNLGMIASSSEVEKLASEIEDNGGVYFVPAFSGLYAPHWNERARGTIIGLTRYVTRAHLARAVLEATAYQTREVLSAMERGFLDPNPGVARRRGHGWQRTADAISGRHSRSAGSAAENHGDYRSRCGVRGRPRGWVLAQSRGPRQQLGGRQALESANGGKSPRRAVGSWQKAVGRSLDWIE